jgi:6-phosphogluconate dehydrogenase (decarboxylating)
MTAIQTQLNSLQSLQNYGQSVWLDYIRRSLITSGELQRMVDDGEIWGVTSNPSIFQKAIAGSSDYDEALKSFEQQYDSPLERLRQRDVMSLYEAFAIKDIQATADCLAPIYQKTHKRDGYVSLEVSPYLSHDTEVTPGRDKVGDTPKEGYLHCGTSGAGHFVKMVHNGIEYGIMAAYAEGLNILHQANVDKRLHEFDAENAPMRDPENYQYDFNLPDITEVWRRGSVIASWLLDLTAIALLEQPDLSKYAGRESDSGEGRWTLITAIDEGVPAPVLNVAVSQRLTSRGAEDFANKLLSAMRVQFGGHEGQHAEIKS